MAYNFSEKKLPKQILDLELLFHYSFSQNKSDVSAKYNLDLQAFPLMGIKCINHKSQERPHLKKGNISTSINQV